jgi:thiol-disulfide isomerase/thioredoxin
MWVVCIVVAVAAIATLLATGGGGGSKASAANQTRPVSVSGTPLPKFTGASPDPAVGLTMPTVSGQSFTGIPVEIKPDGRRHVILFAAHWCPHCNAELPALVKELAGHPLPPSVEMTVISTAVTTSAPIYPPQKWLEQTIKWPTPVMADDAHNTAAGAFGLGSYPYFVFVDARGRVVSRFAGEMPVVQFRATVERLAG